MKITNSTHFIAFYFNCFRRGGRSTRSLLKNFYGIGNENTGTDATLNINTALFDAENHYNHLLVTEPLVDLLHTDNKLVNGTTSEIQKKINSLSQKSED